MRPGKAAATKTDYETLKQYNERIIFLEISAYGDSDPRPGFDAVIQAETGFTYMNGEAGGKPVKMPVALIDILLAHHAKQALLLALLKREKTGLGSHITLSLFDVALSSLANQATNYLMTDAIPQRLGSEHPNISPYGTIYNSSDKKPLVLAVGTDAQFQHLLEILSREDLKKDQRFLKNNDRVIHREELHSILERAIEKHPRAALLRRCEEAGVPAGAVHTMEEVFQLPAAKALTIESDGVKGVHSFVAQGLKSNTKLLPPPSLNQHVEAIKVFAKT